MTEGTADRRTGIAARRAIPASCAIHQQALIRSRVLALAPVLAVLTLAWIGLDALVLPRAALLHAAAGRIAIAGGLFWLATHGRRLPSHVVLRLFVWLQALGFGAMQALLARNHPSSAAAISYGLAPFVIAAQIALFPVSWPQALRLGVAPVAALAVGLLATHVRAHENVWSDVLLLALLLGMAAWTCEAQLRLLVGLSAARDDASHDALTGLANRRAALERLAVEHGRIARGLGAATVLMLDLDRFKQVNDRYGHAAGDRVLQAVAQAIVAELRGCDLGARFGGEEFLVVLAESSLEDAMRAAERIRRRVAALGIDVGTATLSVTISIGVARLRADTAIEDD
ncbi:MAG TPA: diguanylate cyclase, partial [Lysobacter sp.]|nr:diguanylate cyclase [Lysobacter sp.]